jgi:hypothetical protein
MTASTHTYTAPNIEAIFSVNSVFSVANWVSK